MPLLRTLKTRWDFVLFLVCALLLFGGAMFLWGYAAHGGYLFPGPTIKRLNAARKAWLEERRFERLAADTSLPRYERFNWFWFPATESESGVLVHKSEQCSPGYTIFSDATSTVRLIDMQGRELHRWQKNFYEIWPEPRHLIRPVAPEFTYVRTARPLPNGDIFLGYEGMNQSPYGGGLARLDKNSNLLWKLDRSTHHDFDFAPDGRLFALTHRYQSDPILIEDYITVFSPEGRELDEINIFEALQRGPFANMFRHQPTGDFLHTNNLEILDPALADEYPGFEAGDILLSLRNYNTICVYDPRSRSIDWLLFGVAVEQHDPDFIGDNRIAFFDNKGYRVGGRVASRVVEWDIAQSRPVWEYKDIETFDSPVCGAQQRLPNGNYLITESTQGTLLEVTRAGEIVWKYVSETNDGVSVSMVNWATRFPPGYFTFLEDAPAR